MSNRDAYLGVDHPSSPESPPLSMAEVESPGIEMSETTIGAQTNVDIDRQAYLGVEHPSAPEPMAPEEPGIMMDESSGGMLGAVAASVIYSPEMQSFFEQGRDDFLNALWGQDMSPAADMGMSMDMAMESPDMDMDMDI